MYPGSCLSTPVGGVYKIAIHGVRACVFMLSPMVLYLGTRQHGDCTCTCTCAWPPPAPAPAARTCALIAFQRFRGIEFSPGRVRPGVGLSISRNPIQQTGRRHKPMVQESDGRATDQQSQPVTVITARVITYDSCLCWWEMWLHGAVGKGRDLVPVSQFIRTIPPSCALPRVSGEDPLLSRLEGSHLSIPACPGAVGGGETSSPLLWHVSDV